MNKTAPPKRQFGFLGNKYVSFTGYEKNVDGVENIRYCGDSIVGVCMLSYWNKRLKDKLEEKTR